MVLGRRARAHDGYLRLNTHAVIISASIIIRATDRCFRRPWKTLKKEARAGAKAEPIHRFGHSPVGGSPILRQSPSGSKACAAGAQSGSRRSGLFFRLVTVWDAHQRQLSF